MTTTADVAGPNARGPADAEIVNKLRCLCSCGDDCEQQYDGSWAAPAGSVPCVACKAANTLVAALRSLAEMREALEKGQAGAETIDAEAMNANDKLAKLSALILDMNVASPYGLKVKAYARFCMGQGDDPLREAYPHEQEGSESAALARSAP